MQLQVNQPDLTQMFGPDSLYNTLYGMQRQDQATANQNQNLQQAQQDYTFADQMQPFKLQQAGADVAHTNALTGVAQAQTPGIQADSNMKVRSDQVDSMIPMTQKRDAAITKLATGMTEDQLKQHEAQATTDLFAKLPDGSPDFQKRRDAMLVLDNLPEVRAKMREIQQQGANAAGVANIENQGRLSLDKQEAGEGKYAKNTVDYLMYKGFSGNFQQQSGAWAMKAAQLEDQGDMTGAQKARQMSDLARASDRDSKAAAAYTALSKSPDISSLGMTPVVPAAAVAPQVPRLDTSNQPAPQAPQQPVPTQPQPLQAVNPGVKPPPKVGTVTMHGTDKYVYLGGDPSNPSSWRKQ